MVYILDILKNKLVEAEIVLTKKEYIPLKKDGWNFNWRQLSKNDNSQLYILKLIHHEKSVEGALFKKIEKEMLIIDVLRLLHIILEMKSDMIMLQVA